VELNPNGYGWRGTTYTAHRAAVRPRGDGRLDTAPWTTASRTPRFVDLITGAPAPLDTNAAVLWDDDALYIGFWSADPQVTATMTERDTLLFYESDVEVFIDGGDSYYELELNALGTVYEVFYLWRDAFSPGGAWDQPRFDVHQPRVHSFAGDHGPGPESFWAGDHPRGTRWAYLDYDLAGLAVAVHVDGVPNDPTVVDHGWTAEIRIPWSGLSDLAAGRSLPPTDGDVWSIFLGRFQHFATRRPGETMSVGWAVNAHGINDTHVPESFTGVAFSADPG
jgi:Carbohydrate family 9 binding domain-like